MDTKLNIASCKETNTEQVPGMAYVPWQHLDRIYENLEEAYDPNRALRAGTIFPELDKPFTGNCTWNNGGRRR